MPPPFTKAFSMLNNCYLYVDLYMQFFFVGSIGIKITEQFTLFLGVNNMSSPPRNFYTITYFVISHFCVFFSPYS